ncbi:uncharacterized protein LOC124272070 [Haliotis rubra]|uniref:uncharacterized protein LOC124272070 n=1 Tax=Haliotis rubra TaxID=36100 RepID=UPI001EE5F1B2|nr:uncharacterized protein LOC124272070 [Haliotis rubra]
MAPSKPTDCRNGFISNGDITIVPDFESNTELKKSICDSLNRCLEEVRVAVSQPLTTQRKGPKFLVFRPTGRPGDEFQNSVASHLKDDYKMYLITATPMKPSDDFDITQTDLKKLYKHQTKLVINTGKLSEGDTNTKALQSLAGDICKEYLGYVKMRPVTRTACPALVRFMFLLGVFIIILCPQLKTRCMQLVHYIGDALLYP